MAPKTSSATLRLKQDYLQMKNDPVPYVTAEPNPSNILEWYYVVSGPDDSPYAGGYYLGRLVFPADFPFKPPSIYMITPNGRFKTNTRLCLSISDYHPNTWNPVWTVSTILTGLLSFMLENSPTEGSLKTADYEKRHLATKSLEANLQDKNFRELFPDLTATIQNKIEKRKLDNERSQLVTPDYETIIRNENVYDELPDLLTIRNALIKRNLERAKEEQLLKPFIEE